MTRMIAISLVWILALPLCAQTQSPLSPAASKVKAQAQGLPTGGKVTVNMLDGTQYCGTVASIDPESLTVHEVDLQQDLTLRYQAIQRIRKDYGRKGFGSRRVYPRTNRIAGLIILGALLGIVIGAVVADKS